MELTKDRILSLFNILNEKLRSDGARGELTLYGGTVMALVFDSRSSTKDIDVTMEPRDTLKEYVSVIAKEENLSYDWLNEAVRCYLPRNSEDRSVYLELSNLLIYAASPKYMLALKLRASRLDKTSKDYDDIKFLLDYLNVADAISALNIAREYIPEHLIPIEAKAILNNIFSSGSDLYDNA